MKKYYIVSLSTVEYDSWGIKDIFITDKEYKAKFYCSKGNAILAKYRDYFEQLRQDFVFDDNNSYIHISDRADFVMGNFNYSEIEFRSNIKLPLAANP